MKLNPRLIRGYLDKITFLSLSEITWKSKVQRKDENEKEDTTLKLTVLGYLGGYPTKGIGTSSYLLESDGFHLLIDAGSGSLLTLEEHVDPNELDAVLLSHYHADHVADLGVLQFTRNLKKKPDGSRPSLLPIYGHTEDESMFERLTMDVVSEGVPYGEGEPFFVGPFEVNTMKTIHPVPCYAFRITERKTGKVLVFTADSGYTPDYIEFSKGADLLMADANFFEGMENHLIHMTAGETGRIAREAQVGKLLLTHLPQEGDWELLKKQASDQASGIEVVLAEKHLELTI